ncbi:MAG: hypothetical protein QOI31_135 [Solirubrobacterales bacterium]|jgi:hypothetical protein|nr:hypothetical protein [Solirubrobacterales bacterium]
MTPFPLIYNIQHQEEYSRFLPLVKWLLIIPNVFVFFFVILGAFFAWIGAFFAVLVTGRYPEGIFNFLVGVGRWGARLGAYFCLLTDKYPPFSIHPQPDDTVVYDLAYPEQGVDRWRPLVQWLLILPYHLIAMILGYLVGLVSLISFFTILFTKKIPQGLFDMALNGIRWQARSNLYGAFMVTKYPPFEWEPEQPSTSHAAPTEVQPVAQTPPPAPTA